MGILDCGIGKSRRGKRLFEFSDIVTFKAISQFPNPKFQNPNPSFAGFRHLFPRVITRVNKKLLYNFRVIVIKLNNFLNGLLFIC